MSELLLLLALMGPGACDPAPYLVGAEPYVFEYEGEECKGPVSIAIFRVAPDFEEIRDVKVEGYRFAFEGKPGDYRISVCYANGFADLAIELP